MAETPLDAAMEYAAMEYAAPEVLAAAAVVVCACVFAVFAWLRRGRREAREKEDDGIRAFKTLVVLGSGGHTTEMLRLVSALDPKRYCPFVFVVADSDQFSLDKLREERRRDDDLVATVPRSRHVGQSWLTSAWSTLRSLLAAWPIVRRHKPALLLVNGPGTCVPVAVVAWTLNRLRCANIKIVFVESICRVKTLSLSGEIMTPLADEVLVQWPELALKYPNKTKYIARFT